MSVLSGIMDFQDSFLTADPLSPPPSPTKLMDKSDPFVITARIAFCKTRQGLWWPGIRYRDCQEVVEQHSDEITPEQKVNFTLRWLQGNRKRVVRFLGGGGFHVEEYDECCDFYKSAYQVLFGASVESYQGVDNYLNFMKAMDMATAILSPDGSTPSTHYQTALKQVQSQQTSASPPACPAVTPTSTAPHAKKRSQVASKEAPASEDTMDVETNSNADDKMEVDEPTEDSPPEEVEDSTEDKMEDDDLKNHEDSLVISPKEAWDSVWKKLESMGWDEISNARGKEGKIYVNPDGQGSRGVDGTDYFHSLGALQDYVSSVHGWTKPRERKLGTRSSNRVKSPQKVTHSGNGTELTAKQQEFYKFKNLWTLLRKHGWKHASSGTSLATSWFYVRPGCKVRGGTKGTDYFEQEEEVVTYALANNFHETFADEESSIEDTSDVEESISDESSEDSSRNDASTVESSQENAATLVTQSSAEGPNEKKEGPKQPQTQASDRASAQRSLSLGTRASTRASAPKKAEKFTHSRDGTRLEKREQDFYVFKNLWPFLKKQHKWTYAKSSSLTSNWLYIRPGCNAKDGVKGKDYFEREEDVVAYALANNFHEMYLSEESSVEATTEEESLVEDSSHDDAPSVGSSEASEEPATPNSTDDTEGCVTSKQTRIEHFYVFARLLEYLKGAGWRVETGKGKYKLYDFMYIRPGSTVKDGVLGRDIFVDKEDLITYAQTHNLHEELLTDASSAGSLDDDTPRKGDAGAEVTHEKDSTRNSSTTEGQSEALDEFDFPPGDKSEATTRPKTKKQSKRAVKYGQLYSTPDRKRKSGQHATDSRKRMKETGNAENQGQGSLPWWKTEYLLRYEVFPIIQKLGFTYSSGYRHKIATGINAGGIEELAKVLCKRGIPFYEQHKHKLNEEESTFLERWISFAFVPCTPTGLKAIRAIDLPTNEEALELLGGLGFKEENGKFITPAATGPNLCNPQGLVEGVNYFASLDDLRDYLRGSEVWGVAASSDRKSRRKSSRPLLNHEEMLKLRVWAALSPNPLPTFFALPGELAIEKKRNRTRKKKHVAEESMMEIDNTIATPGSTTADATGDLASTRFETRMGTSSHAATANTNIGSKTEAGVAKSKGLDENNKATTVNSATPNATQADDATGRKTTLNSAPAQGEFLTQTEDEPGSTGLESANDCEAKDGLEAHPQVRDGNQPGSLTVAGSGHQCSKANVFASAGGATKSASPVLGASDNTGLAAGMEAPKVLQPFHGATTSPTGDKGVQNGVLHAASPSDTAAKRGVALNLLEKMDAAAAEPSQQPQAVASERQTNEEVINEAIEEESGPVSLTSKKVVVEQGLSFEGKGDPKSPDKEMSSSQSQVSDANAPFDGNMLRKIDEVLASPGSPANLPATGANPMLLTQAPEDDSEMSSVGSP